MLLVGIPILCITYVVFIRITYVTLRSGPHEGTIPDNVIYNETYQDHPQYSWEFWVGDGIYDSYALANSINLTDFLLIRCFGVITRFCLVAGQVFNRAMVAVNTWLNHYRQRVEHTMADIKDHAIWKRKFRGRWGR